MASKTVTDRISHLFPTIDLQNPIVADYGSFFPLLSPKSNRHPYTRPTSTTGNSDADIRELLAKLSFKPPPEIKWSENLQIKKIIEENNDIIPDKQPGDPSRETPSKRIRTISQVSPSAKRTKIEPKILNSSSDLGDSGKENLSNQREDLKSTPELTPLEKAKKHEENSNNIKSAATKLKRAVGRVKLSADERAALLIQAGVKYLESSIESEYALEIYRKENITAQKRETERSVIEMYRSIAKFFLDCVPLVKGATSKSFEALCYVCQAVSLQRAFGVFQSESQRAYLSNWIKDIGKNPNRTVTSDNITFLQSMRDLIESQSAWDRARDCGIEVPFSVFSSASVPALVVFVTETLKQISS